MRFWREFFWISLSSLDFFFKVTGESRFLEEVIEFYKFFGFCEIFGFEGFKGVSFVSSISSSFLFIKKINKER